MRTKYEQETIINYNNEEKTASIYTFDKVLMKKIDARAAESDDVKVVRRGEDWAEYVVPKKSVKLNWPKKYTDEQREAMANRMKKVRNGNEG